MAITCGERERTRSMTGKAAARVCTGVSGMYEEKDSTRGCARWGSHIRSPFGWCTFLDSECYPVHTLFK